MIAITLNRTSIRRSLLLFVAMWLTTFVAGCASPPATYGGQRTFGQPEAAAEGLAAAVLAGNTSELEAIFGTEGRRVISSGDPVYDRHSREVFSIALNEGWELVAINSNTRELVIGNENWPFPIPIVKDHRGWWFDTLAGEEEIRVRRIGRNEIGTIRTLRTYAVAQREYASVGRDGKAAGIFAQQVRSDPGQHNGLYWPVTNSQEESSPLGELVAAATSEGYGQAKEGAAPFRGYFFRILKEQGEAATGGAMNYVVNSEMTGGFAMIAYPAEYGTTGVMTFLVGPDGTIFERDLGNGTADVASGIVAYNPSRGWRKVD